MGNEYIAPKLDSMAASAGRWVGPVEVTGRASQGRSDDPSVAQGDPGERPPSWAHVMCHSFSEGDCNHPAGVFPVLPGTSGPKVTTSPPPKTAINKQINKLKRMRELVNVNCLIYLGKVSSGSRKEWWFWRRRRNPSLMPRRRNLNNDSSKKKKSAKEEEIVRKWVCIVWP